VLAGCGDPGSHIFAGGLFEPSRGCIDPPTAIDVVGGKDTGAGCMALCIVGSAAADAAAPVYVSSTCPPYPHGFELSADGGASGVCAAALAAYARNDRCLEDGGSSAPTPDSG
jgi:hypothetical protein